MNKVINKNRFVTLGKALAKAGIDIDYQINWSESINGNIQ